MIPVAADDKMIANRKNYVLSKFATVLLVLATLVMVSAPRCLHAQAQVLTAEDVERAISRSSRWLAGQQRDNGSWSLIAAHKGGVEGLATLSLVLAGADKRGAAVQNGLRYLNSLDPLTDGLSVYTVSLMAMVYAEVDADLYRARIRKCVQYLVESQIPSGAGRGGWAYGIERTPTKPDGSNTQFAILALSEAARAGIQVEQEVWQRARWYWESMYKGRGGFIYREDTHHSQVITGSMVCAAIASLIIIDENLNNRPPIKNGLVACCVGEERLEMVEEASQWMADHFTTRSNPADGYSIFRDSRYYYLYSMERAARLSGQRFFGEFDWYREGARALVALQRDNGRWETSVGHGEKDSPHVATALALLFLSKGRRPVVIGKYQHSDGDDWDRHRKGVHYLTRALEADWDVKLSWQSVDGRVASLNDLREVPVLHISGKDRLRLSRRQKEALKKYIEYGGFVFAEACEGDGCGSNSRFDSDCRALMAELIPENELQPLSPAHPIYNAQYNLPLNPDWALEGIQTSCRTSVVYCQRNLAGFWRVNRPSFEDALPPTAKKQVDYTIQLGVNVVTYATGRAVKDKLDSNQDLDVGFDGPGERIVMIPKLAHGGSADAAPNAWQNIMRRAGFDLKQRFKIERQLINAETDALQKYPMVFMHGRSPFQWSEDERQALRTYLTEIGFLFSDSICSADGYVESFRNEMKAVFPDHPLQKIPADDPLWSDARGGYDLQQVSIHEPAKNQPGGVRRLKSPPLMEGIKVDGRWVVVFSPIDLSCAMENGAAAQCRGYDKDDAARLGVNIILNALLPDR